MKITVIGGGSTYTPELALGFIKLKDSLPLDELCLMDIDPQRLEIVGGFVQRIVKAQGSPFKVTLSTNQREAISGASYVVTQFRVGQMQARVNDEYFSKRYNLVGQETTGMGGMAKALRTIPVMLSIAKDIRETAPDALLVNFTNPAGLNTEALTRYAPDTQAVGVCNVAITAKMMILEGLEKMTGKKIDPNTAQLNTLGLNHLTWHRGFAVNGEEYWPQIIAGQIEELKQAEDPEWDIEMIKTLQMIPNYYLQYYYHTNHKLALQEKWPPSRGEEVVEIEKRLLKLYADPQLSQPPEDLMERGGAWYSTMATRLLNAHYNDLNEIHITNVRHNGAVPGWPSDWVLEMPCQVGKKGVDPLPCEPLPQVCAGLIAAVKSYELHTVEAAVHGSREELYKAILAHPLKPPADQIPALIDDLLEINKPHLPQFWS